MSDQTINQFLSQADDSTARVAFVPAPPTPVADLPNGYLCYQRDTQALYAWDSDLVAWVFLIGGSPTAAVQVASVALTDANIKALPTTPITVVAAPGAGYRIKILGATLSINNTAGDYTNINATYAAIGLQSTNYLALPMFDDATIAGAEPPTQVTAFLAGTNGRKYHDFQIPDINGRDGGATAGDWTYVLSPPPRSSTEVDNAAVTLTADNNSSGNFTGGNAANVGLIVVTYTIEALAP